MKNVISINQVQIYDLFNSLREAEENLILQGNMSDELTVPLIDYSSLGSGKEKISQKKLSFFIAESFQNIIRHGKSDELNSRVKAGTYGITKYKDIITLHSSNSISDDEVDSLDNRLNGLTILSPDELRDLYIKVLGESELSEKGGAGLGLIEMVRKSKGGIKHKVERNPSNNYFHFDVSLNKNEGDEQPFNSLNFNEMMQKNQIIFLIKTKFNHEKFIYLNEIVNRKIIDSRGTKSINIHQMNYVFIELIQNIYKHGFGDSEEGKEGIFLLRNTARGAQFYSGNYITHEDAEDLEETLNQLNNFSKEKLDELYKTTLMKNINFDLEFSAGLGLIEMKRMTPHEFDFAITPINDDISFFVNSIILEH